MRLHGNPRTCPQSRLLMVRRVEEEGWTLARAADAAGVSVRTVSKWLRCYRLEGREGCWIARRRRAWCRTVLRRSACRQSPRCAGCG
jgi:transposase